MGNILGPARHQIHHDSARAPHPEHDSREPYDEGGGLPYLAQAVERGRGEAIMSEEPHPPPPAQPDRNVEQYQQRAVDAAHGTEQPMQPMGGQRGPQSYGTPQRQGTPQSDRNGQAVPSAELNRRAEEAIVRFREIEEMQAASRQYLQRLDERIKDLRGVQQRIETEVQRSSSSQTMYYADEQAYEPAVQRETYMPRETSPDRALIQRPMTPTPDQRRNKQYIRKSYESSNSDSTSIGTSDATSFSNYHEVFVRAPANRVERQGQQYGRGWDPAKRAQELEEEANAREGRGRKYESVGDRQQMKKRTNPIIRILAFDF